MSCSLLFDLVHIPAPKKSGCSEKLARFGVACGSPFSIWLSWWKADFILPAENVKEHPFDYRFRYPLSASNLAASLLLRAILLLPHDVPSAARLGLPSSFFHLA
jgi:hypothetical protein